MTKKQKGALLRILLAGAALIALIVLDRLGRLELLLPWQRLGLYLVPYLLVGSGVLWEAVAHIFHGQIFDENFLMAIASIAAFCVGEYPAR